MDRTAIGLILLFQWKWLSLSSISLCFKESFYTSFWVFLFPLIKIIVTVIKGSTHFHHYRSSWSGPYSGRLVSESMMNREEGHDQQRGRTKKKIMVSHVKLACCKTQFTTWKGRWWLSRAICCPCWGSWPFWDCLLGVVAAATSGGWWSMAARGEGAEPGVTRHCSRRHRWCLKPGGRQMGHQFSLQSHSSLLPKFSCFAWGFLCKSCHQDKCFWEVAVKTIQIFFMCS